MQVKILEKMEAYLGLYIPIKKCNTNKSRGGCVCVCEIGRYFNIFSKYFVLSIQWACFA